MAVVTNPITGKMETVPDKPEVPLERARRELRDMIEGNTPLHQDTYARPKPMGCYCEALLAGTLCNHCKDKSNA